MKLKTFTVCLLVLVAALPVFGQSSNSLPTHPRGLITGGELEILREKIKKEPFKTMLERIRKEEARLDEAGSTIYEKATLVKLKSFLAAITQDQMLAGESYENISELVADTKFVQNPFSKGLTRAHVLCELAYAYDFSFNLWTDTQLRFVNNALYDLMSSVNNNMGAAANYHLESNWMGVRYGSVALAASVIDEEYLDQSTMKKNVKAFRWDSKERLRDHLKMAFTPKGWFSETLGYHVYDFMFVCPAIISLQNSSGQNAAFDLENYAPQLLHSLDQHITATVNMDNGHAFGIKPDLGDDNANSGISHFAFGMRLMPDTLRPYLKWMLEYLKKSEDYQDDFLALALSAQDVKTKSPNEGGFLNYADDTQGVVLFRNGFKDENDIVACFNTSSKRIHGHAGPDNLTFRIMGLGSLWAIGAGRTGQVAGQTNLFPDGNWQKQKQKGVEGKLIDYKFEKDGSGFGLGTGSCMGVKNHRRKFTVDYSQRTGAEAVFIIEDKSENGKTWRMNTPEFNEVTILKNGFLLNAPNGATLKAIVRNTKQVNVSTEVLRYGGKTVAHNTGIGYGGKKYANTTAIDISCDGEISVIMTLQTKGMSHPNISWSASKEW
ncbi:MAG: hypothetical protein JXQ96_13590 [Cyclobacteriaceae bacterium]